MSWQCIGSHSMYITTIRTCLTTYIACELDARHPGTLTACPSSSQFAYLHDAGRGTVGLGTRRLSAVAVAIFARRITYLECTRGADEIRLRWQCLVYASGTDIPTGLVRAVFSSCRDARLSIVLVTCTDASRDMSRLGLSRCGRYAAEMCMSGHLLVEGISLSVGHASAAAFRVDTRATSGGGVQPVRRMRFRTALSVLRDERRALFHAGDSTHAEFPRRSGYPDASSTGVHPAVPTRRGRRTVRARTYCMRKRPGNLRDRARSRQRRIAVTRVQRLGATLTVPCMYTSVGADTRGNPVCSVLTAHREVRVSTVPGALLLGVLSAQTVAGLPLS